MTLGYQLTWMDAKVGDWVVTPRRGKAVEINALWYNALRLLEGWVRAEQDEPTAQRLAEHAALAYQSFNDRFWYAAGGYLYDVIDGEQGDDPAGPIRSWPSPCAMPPSHQRAGSRCSRLYSSVCLRLWACGRWRLTILSTRHATTATCVPAPGPITRALSGPGS